MASFVQYPGDGSTKIFAVPFPYLDPAHVRITIDGVLYVNDLEWLNEAIVELIEAPANDAIVDIRRVTPVDVPIVDFTDGSVLTERNLDLMARWLQYTVEENRDNSMQVNTLGQWEGASRRIQNVQDPVDAQDVVTKDYADSLAWQGVEIPEIPEPVTPAPPPSSNRIQLKAAVYWTAPAHAATGSQLLAAANPYSAFDCLYMIPLVCSAGGTVTDAHVFLAPTVKTTLAAAYAASPIKFYLYRSEAGRGMPGVRAHAGVFSTDHAQATDFGSYVVKSLAAPISIAVEQGEILWLMVHYPGYSTVVPILGRPLNTAVALINGGGAYAPSASYHPAGRFTSYSHLASSRHEYTDGPPEDMSGYVVTSADFLGTSHSTGNGPDAMLISPLVTLAVTPT